MNSKYQNYYNKLNGQNFGSCTSKYSSAMQTVKSKLSNVESTISSSKSSWTEAGLTVVQGTTLPNIMKQEASVEKGLTALNSAVSKISTLVSKLAELDSLCKAYASCEEEQKSSYQSKISAKEGEIDTLISEINSITIETEKANPAGDLSGTGTGDATVATAPVKELTDIEAKKAAFLGDVDDESQYTYAKNYKGMRKIMQGFDNTTGEILDEHSTIHMKPGETRIITVKLPTNTGPIGEIRRTTADGDGTYRSGKVLKGKSDVNPDPNVVDYVNYQSQVNHWPKGVDLHQNHYDWILTADKSGKVRVSQTCEYTTKDNPNWLAKAMYVLNVVVD